MSYYQLYQPSSYNSKKVGLLLIHTRYLGGGSSQGHCQLVGLRNAISLNQSGPIRAQADHITGCFVN
jgi:hypothetical protein